MNRDLARAIYDVLANDSTLTGYLTTFESNPSIFLAEPVPESVQPPYISTDSVVSDVPFDAHGHIGRTVNKDIKAYTDADGSLLVDDIIDRVRELLNHVTFSTATGTVVQSIVTSVGQAPTEETRLMGRVATVEIIWQE